MPEFSDSHLPEELAHLIRDRSAKDLASLRDWIARANGVIDRDSMVETLVRSGWPRPVVDWYLEQTPAAAGKDAGWKAEAPIYTVRRPANLFLIVLMSLFASLFVVYIVGLVYAHQRTPDYDLPYDPNPRQPAVPVWAWFIAAWVLLFAGAARGLLVGGIYGRIAYYAASTLAFLICVWWSPITLSALLLAGPKCKMFAWWPNRRLFQDFCAKVAKCPKCSGKKRRWSGILCSSYMCADCGSIVQVTR